MDEVEHSGPFNEELHKHATSCLLHKIQVTTMFDRFKRTVFTFFRIILGFKMTSAWVKPVVLPLVTENVLTYSMRMASIKKGDRLVLLQNGRLHV